MKKKWILLLVIFVNISYICYSQVQEGSVKKVKSVQNEYFTKELVLTSEEGEKFWPLYKSYKSEIRAARKEFKADQIVLEEKVLNIRKKYKAEFKNVLGSDDRVNKLFVVERNFKEILKQELLQRKVTGNVEQEDQD